MKSNKKIFIYYLTNLLAKGENESVSTIRKLAANGSLISYLSEKYSAPNLKNLANLSELNEELANYAYTREDKYLIEEPINGLALLLCLLVDYE